MLACRNESPTKSRREQGQARVRLAVEVHVTHRHRDVAWERLWKRVLSEVPGVVRGAGPNEQG